MKAILPMAYDWIDTDEEKSSIRWQGRVVAVQCRAWVWRYRTDNRTHHHLGFNLWLDGEADGKNGRFVVAVSDTQHGKMQFKIGDELKGTAWPCIDAKHDIADYYRAGGFKRLGCTEERAPANGPPFSGLLPPLAVFEKRGARMLDAKLWRKACFTCMWANKSAVEIEYKFGEIKRYRKETFCYGPRSCPLYAMGPPRPVQYIHTFPVMDEGWLDELCTEGRGEDD
jgi:hypothetical protein